MKAGVTCWMRLSVGAVRIGISDSGDTALQEVEVCIEA